MKHTCEVRPTVGAKPGEPTVTIEFWRAGQLIEIRSYLKVERFLVGDRVIEWVVDGKLS